MRAILLSLIPVIAAFYLYYKFVFIPVQQEQKEAKKQCLQNAIDEARRENAFEFAGQKPD